MAEKNFVDIVTQELRKQIKPDHSFAQQGVVISTSHLFVTSRLVQEAIEMNETLKRIAKAVEKLHDGSL